MFHDKAKRTQKGNLLPTTTPTQLSYLYNLVQLIGSKRKLISFLAVKATVHPRTDPVIIEIFNYDLNRLIKSDLIGMINKKRYGNDNSMALLTKLQVCLIVLR